MNRYIEASFGFQTLNLYSHPPGTYLLFGIHKICHFRAFDFYHSVYSTTTSDYYVNEHVGFRFSQR